MSEVATVKGCRWLISLYTELSSSLSLCGSCSTPKEERKLEAPPLPTLSSTEKYVYGTSVALRTQVSYYMSIG